MEALINVKKNFDPELGIRSVTVERKSGDVFQYLVAKELVFFFRLIGCIAVIEEKDMTSAESNSSFGNNSTDEKYNDLDLGGYNFDPDIMEKLYKLISSLEKSGTNESNQETDLLISLISSHEEKSMQNEQVLTNVITSLENILGKETTETIHNIYNIFRKYNIFKNLYRYKYFLGLLFIEITDEIVDSIYDFIQAYIELHSLTVSNSKLSKIYKLMAELYLSYYCAGITNKIFSHRYAFDRRYYDKFLEFTGKINDLKIFWHQGECKKKIDTILNLSDGQFYGADIVAGNLSYKATDYGRTDFCDCNYFIVAYKKIQPEMKCASFLLIKHAFQQEVGFYKYLKIYAHKAFSLDPQNLKNLHFYIIAESQTLKIKIADGLHMLELFLTFFEFFEKNKCDMLDHGDLITIKYITRTILFAFEKQLEDYEKINKKFKKSDDSIYRKFFYFFKSFLRKYSKCRNSVIKYLFKDKFKTYKYISVCYTTFAYAVLTKTAVSAVHDFNYEKYLTLIRHYREGCDGNDEILREKLKLQFPYASNRITSHGGGLIKRKE